MVGEVNKLETLLHTNNYHMKLLIN